MKRIFVFLTCALLLCGVVSAEIIASKIYVDPNPTPNMTETYVPLKLVKTIGPEISPDVFIYRPLSLTLDKEGNLYVFDRAQHRIVQLDKDLKFVRFIGRDGQGPGEFVKAPGAAVFINVGLDNKLYCNDTAAFKTLVFDTNGKYITDYRNPGVIYCKPTVDKNGQLYFFSGNDHEMEAKNQDGKSILKIPVNPKGFYSTLFYRQTLRRNSFDSFFYSSFVDPGNLLLCFSNSSTMLNVSGKKIVQKYRILPKDLLLDYKEQAKKVAEAKLGKLALFSRIIPDGDVSGIYYLPSIVNYSTNRSVLYQMNLEGELQNAYYFDYGKNPSMLWFLAKKNDCFYARKAGDEVIQVYKEEE